MCRLTLTDLDKQGRDLVSRWAREAGMSITIDKIGNGFLRRPGRNNALPPIMTGSHIDTQPTGGKFDGNYGVLAGHGGGAHAERPRHPDRSAHRGGLVDERRRLALRAGDDGLRRAFAKAFTLEHAYAAKDTAGLTVKDELARIGYIGTEEPGEHPIGAYFETHIEQGPVLEDNGKTIGVVTGVLGIRWYDCTVTGMEAHAGPDAHGAAQGRAAGGRQADAGGGGLRPPPPAVKRRKPRARHGGHGACAPQQPQRHPGQRVKFSIDLRNASDALVRRHGRRHPRRGREAQRPKAGCRSTITPVSAYPAHALPCRLHRTPWARAAASNWATPT